MLRGHRFDDRGASHNTGNRLAAAVDQGMGPTEMIVDLRVQGNAHEVVDGRGDVVRRHGIARAA